MTLVVDSSAIVAIALGEPDQSELLGAVSQFGSRHASVATILECTIRAGRDMSGSTLTAMDRTIAALRLTHQPVTLDQLEIAREAFLWFGKGRGHPAQLNFGDCFSYALAKAMRAPLLFKGRDFHLTDITPALPQTRAKETP